MKKSGEFEYIKKFSANFLDNLPQGVVGIGDDCAIIPYIDNSSLLMSTDTLVDSVHFLSEKMRASDIAYKALVVNLSDIAAMGGKPHYVLLTLTIPKYIDEQWLDEYFAGFKDSCQRYGVYLIGGDITKSPDKLVIGVTVIGTASTENIRFRSTAKEGDYICVTGNIGDSTAGLHCYLEDNKGFTPSTNKLRNAIEKLKQAHLLPRPHIDEGEWLAAQNGVNAMIDISDGIESDIKRIMERSLCGATIELNSIPLSQDFIMITREKGWNSYEMAATGGEDYCLLVTIEPDKYELLTELFKQRFPSNLTRIGTITTEGLTFLLDGEKVELTKHGFDHFK